MSQDKPPVDRRGPPRGTYKHFKGDVYRCLGVGVVVDHDAMTRYAAYHPPLLPTEIFLRDADKFQDPIDREGYQGPRFRYLGDIFSPQEHRLHAMEDFIDWCLAHAAVAGGVYHHVATAAITRLPELQARYDELRKNAGPIKENP